mmetsp:Transcript_6396/g.15745  ORF Transcript_6396/g.15745 Transcript_6396/m.15745 type:complete len:201 (+) Transcript_6396:950-1552(+)
MGRRGHHIPAARPELQRPILSARLAVPGVEAAVAGAAAGAAAAQADDEEDDDAGLVAVQASPSDPHLALPSSVVAQLGMSAWLHRKTASQHRPMLGVLAGRTARLLHLGWRTADMQRLLLRHLRPWRPVLLVRTIERHHGHLSSGQLEFPAVAFPICRRKQRERVVLLRSSLKRRLPHDHCHLQQELQRCLCSLAELVHP